MVPSTLRIRESPDLLASSVDLGEDGRDLGNFHDQDSWNVLLSFFLRNNIGFSPGQRNRPGGLPKRKMMKKVELKP